MPNLRSTDALGMNVKTLKNIAAIACVAALAVPAGVLAKGPGGDHGKSGARRGQKNKPHHVNKRCKKQPKVGFVVGGKLAQGAAADNVSFVVTHSNKHARTFFPKGSTYAVADADESKIQYKGDIPLSRPGPDLHPSDCTV